MSEGFFASLRSIASSVTQKLETAQTQYEYNMDIADQTNKSQHIIDQMQHRQQTLQVRNFNLYWLVESEQ